MIKVLLALGLITSPQVLSEAVETPTTETTTEELEEVKKDIMDLIEQWKETEVIAGITWGAIISTCVSITGIVVSSIYYGRKLKSALKTNQSNNKQLDVLKTENEELKTRLETLNGLLTEYNEHLKAMEETNTKVDLLLESQLKMACNDDALISSGYAKEFKEKIEGKENE